MCSFTVLGVRGVQKPVSIWCDHHLPSPSHRVDQVVDCGLWNVGPLLFNGCAKLLDIGRNWNTQSFADPEHPKHAQWVTCQVKSSQVCFIVNSATCTAHTYIQRIEIVLLSDPWCIQLTLNTDSRRTNTDKYKLYRYTNEDIVEKKER